MEFFQNPINYNDLFLPQRNIAESFKQTFSFLMIPRAWTEGDFNQWTLNDVMAVNPVVRLLTSLMYLSDVKGLSRIYYANSNFLEAIDFAKLKQKTDNRSFTTPGT